MELPLPMMRICSNTFRVDWFVALDAYAQGKSGQKIWLYCNSDWLEQTTAVYDSKGNVKGGKVSDDDAYGKTVPQLKKQWVAFWSDDEKGYYFGPPYNTNPPTYCADAGNIAVVTPLSTGKESLSLTLCPAGFFKKPDTLESIDDTSSDIGHALQKLEPRSLSIVHELVHASQGPANTTMDAILTAQKTNPRQPTENTPESYAWAALAVYLAENGAKMDYSTGLARPIGEPLASPWRHQPLEVESSGGRGWW
ncbi:uncharacterized protein N7482_010468 [Penicillium canariense]|uniref:Uncharacterized protein n=1 Tax=Penicillium canariense TaxID=189055 RepID=A0A9W9HMP9_9EURO|nr:uncharacterized protein N7482_010468 [Penicillium canariense]KAJ5151216.1 hypothetical protein N7482_010468 [Penicillium canariense]